MVKSDFPKRSILGLLILLLASQTLAQINHYYVMEISYDNGTLSLQKMNVEPLTEEAIQTQGYYIAEVVSSENKILNLTFFEISSEILFDYYNTEIGVISGGDVLPNKTKKTLYVPYYSNAKEINIYDWDLVQRLQLNVSSYAKELPNIAAPEEMKKPTSPEGTDKIKLVAEEESAAITIAVAVSIGLLFIMMVIVLILRKKKK